DRIAAEVDATDVALEQHFERFGWLPVERDAGIVHLARCRIAREGPGEMVPTTAVQVVVGDTQCERVCERNIYCAFNFVLIVVAKTGLHISGELVQLRIPRANE